jgi:putative ABC transport system permease protein
MNAVTLALRELVGRPVRTALTVLGIAIAIAGYIALTGLTRGVASSIDSGLAETGADLIVSQPGAFTLSGSTLSEALAARLRAVPGLEDVSGVLFNVTSIDDEANVVSTGWPDESFLWRSVPLAAGRLPASGEAGTIVLGEAIARALGKGLGDQVTLRFKPFRIVGIARFTSVLNQNLALLRLSELQALLSRDGLVTFYQVRLARPTDAARVSAARTALTQAAPGLSVQESAQLASDLRLVAIIRAVASTISVVVICLAILGVGNTLFMAINERTHDIGVLSAIGWPASRILVMILSEGLAMAAVGAALGLGLGIAAMTLAARSPVAAGLLQPYLDAGMIAEALAAALLIGLLGALVPAWRAVRMSPAAALRRV